MKVEVLNNYSLAFAPEPYGLLGLQGPQGPILLNEGTLLQLDNLIEESMMDTALNKVSSYLSKIGDSFQTKADIERYVKSEQTAQKNREKYLKDNGVDIEKFKDDLKKGIPTAIEWKEIVKSLILEAKETTSSTTVLKNVAGVGVVVLMNTMFYIILSPVVPPIAAMYLTALVSAPIVEEMFKRLTVGKNQGFLGNAIFNIVEFSLYVSNPIVGLPMLILVIGRILAVGLHSILTITHQKGKMLDKYKEDFGIKDFKKDASFKNTASKLAMGAHALNNGLGGNIMVGLAASLATVNSFDKDMPKKVTAKKKK